MLDTPAFELAQDDPVAIDPEMLLRATRSMIRCGDWFGAKLGDAIQGLFQTYSRH